METLTPATEAEIIGDFRHYGFTADHIPASDRRDQAEFIRLRFAASNQAAMRDIVTGMLASPAASLEITREEPGCLYLAEKTAEPLKLTPVTLDGEKMCSGHRGPIPAGPAFEDADGRVLCTGRADHITTCTDPDCEH